MILWIVRAIRRRYHRRQRELDLGHDRSRRSDLRVAALMPLMRRYSGDDGAPGWWISPILSAWLLVGLMVFGLIAVVVGIYVWVTYG
jgi:hypothetical protein